MTIEDLGSHAIVSGATATATAAIIAALTKWGVLFAKHKKDAAAEAMSQAVSGFVDLIKLQQATLDGIRAQAKEDLERLSKEYAEAIQDGERRHAQCIADNAELRSDVQKLRAENRIQWEKMAEMNDKITTIEKKNGGTPGQHG